MAEHSFTLILSGDVDAHSTNSSRQAATTEASEPSTVSRTLTSTARRQLLLRPSGRHWPLSRPSPACGCCGSA